MLWFPADKAEDAVTLDMSSSRSKRDRDPNGELNDHIDLLESTGGNPGDGSFESPSLIDG